MTEGRDFGAASTVGTRVAQEDDWGTHAKPPALEKDACLLAAVADGMGGAPAGDQASQIVVGAFFDSYLNVALPAKERMREAMLRANRAIDLAVSEKPELAGMGTTLVAALFRPDRCEWLSVGDSLILLYRNGKIESIATPHIYAKDLDEKARRGDISAEQAYAHPDRNALTSALMGGTVDEVDSGELELLPGDLVLLASDGVAALRAEEVAAICTREMSQDAACIAEALIAQIDARQREGQDNATVVVVRRPADEMDTLLIRKPEQCATSADRVATEETPGCLDGSETTQSNPSRLCGGYEC